MKKLLLILLLFPMCLSGQILTTIAGTGAAGYYGDGGLAVNAQFNHPDKVTFDHSGNMYIADEHNHVIRKISTDNVISTVAGNGHGAGTIIGGYSGDNGPATNAELSRPDDVIFDAAGNMYITELGNCTIRKVTPGGIITTIAGTGAWGFNGDNISATSAQLADPFGIVFDNLGNLYFSDNANYRVRKISTNGIISTVVGTGMQGDAGEGGAATAAQIRAPGYLAISSSGELYIGDYMNHRVQKVDVSGNIHTIAGTGTNSSTGDSGPASAATMQSPFGVFFDPGGNLYISDRVASVIREVNTAGIITTIAGTGTAGYNGENLPATSADINGDALCSAIDEWGNLYMADPVNNRIRRITYNTAGITETAQNNISIYPNPAQNKLTISAATQINTITITNLLGQVVASPQPLFDKLTMTGEREVLCDISGLPPGVYVLRVNEVYVRRLVKEQ